MMMNIETSAKQLDNAIDNKTEIIIPKRVSNDCDRHTPQNR